MIIGIDPGKTGGMACLTDDGKVCWTHEHCSTVAYLDELIIARDGCDTSLFAFVERAQSFPGQGISSTFNYAQGYGEIIGCLIALRIRFELVPPAIWTKEILLGAKPPKGKKDKTRNIETARRLFPDEAEIRKNKPHLGIVDALLIAEYGRRRRKTS